MNRIILSEILQDEYDIIEASTGEECLRLLEEYGTGLALILLDIVMPGMDGFGVLDYMNRNHWIEEVPVIMISSEDSTTFVRRAYEQGVSDYISRPFDAKVVYQRVFNTIKLYAKQRRLVTLVTEQIYEKRKQSDDDQYPESYHGIPEWRERTSCPPHQRSDQYAPRASGTEDRPLPLKLVRSADDHNGIRAARYRKDGH